MEKESGEYVRKLEERVDGLLREYKYVVVHFKEYYMDGVGEDATFLYPSDLEDLVEDSMDLTIILDYLNENAKLLLTLYLSESESIMVYEKN